VGDEPEKPTHEAQSYGKRGIVAEEVVRQVIYSNTTTKQHKCGKRGKAFGTYECEEAVYKKEL
jgi:hypothetical protein